MGSKTQTAVNIKDKENLKVSREKRLITGKEMSIRPMADFSQKKPEDSRTLSVCCRPNTVCLT